MPSRRSARAVVDRAVVATGITVFGCGPDEEVLFREHAPDLGVTLTITDAEVSDAVELARGNRCISISHKHQVTRSALRALSRAGVRYISTRSVGFDHLDVVYAQRIGISVENVAYSPDGVADYTVMLMLMTVRDAKHIIRRADSHDFRLNAVRGKELRDLTVGVIGTGRIGAAVIDRLRGFGCRILAYDNEKSPCPAEYVSLDELLRQSDIVTLHAPLTDETHHLLDQRRLTRMKYGAHIVNTGRGALLDTEAAASALESGRLGGAALDVVEGEEGVFYADWRDRPLDNALLTRLQRLPNVLISPHTAYYTDRALKDTVQNSLLNCLNFESGDRHG